MAEPPEATIDELMTAGSAALTFNAPLGPERAEALIDRLSVGRPQGLVDLGCGRGALARLAATRLPTISVIGIDLDQAAIDQARSQAGAAGLGDRVRFEVGDITAWSPPSGTAVDAAVCVGASHAFGGPEGLLGQLARLVPTGRVIVGDGVWTATPDPWCEETFGTLPSGPEALASLARDRGWTVEGIDTSTLDEWDAFEHGWIDGVRSVGTEAAASFADQRASEYQRYRGVLGFAWLELTR